MSASSVSSEYRPSEWTDWTGVAGWRTIRSCTLENGAVIQVFRCGDAFIVDSVWNGRRCQHTLELDMPPDAFEQIAKRHIPYLEADGKVGFMWERKSLFHNDTPQGNLTIDGDHWSVTVIDTGQSRSVIKEWPWNRIKRTSPCTWGGHAALIVEKIDEKGYTVWKADIIRGLCLKRLLIDDFLVEVRWVQLSADQYPALAQCPHTETWIKSHSAVQKMIQQISREAERSQRKESIWPDRSVLFDMAGGRNGGSTYNCIHWVRERAFLAGIFIPPKISFIEVPVAYTGESLILRGIQKIRGMQWVNRDAPFHIPLYSDVMNFIAHRCFVVFNSLVGDNRTRFRTNQFSTQADLDFYADFDQFDKFAREASCGRR